MLQIREKVENNMLWKINADTCSLWWDNLSDKGALANFFPDHHHNRHTTVSEYMINGGWDLNKLAIDFEDRMTNIIDNIVIGDLSLEDFILWKPSNDGLYTNLSSFQVNRDKKQEDVSLGSLWHNCIPFKVSFLAWRACLSKLPFNENLSRFAINEDTDCSYCSIATRDSLQHTFIEGEAAKHLWNHFGSPLVIRHTNWPIRRLLKHWRATTTTNSVHKLIVNIVPLAICWEIWRMWTACRYGDQNKFYIRKMEYHISWTINAAITKAFPTCCFSWPWPNLCRDVELWRPKTVHSHVVAAFSKSIQCSSHNIAEAMAAREGIHQCLHLGFRKFQIELDSQIIVNMLKARDTNNLRLKGIILSSVKAMNQANVDVTYCYREANHVADLLAKNAAGSGNSFQYCLMPNFLETLKAHFTWIIGSYQA
ncbi:uncharacterized protein LOC132624428 [Lycium barbarum]|uniref:uncharacterized protein LOC132624428 n=1 Tax=Lycium barbarum TaxID=112863 RepID=UPI00293E15DA|nr:uncharacterized protein LOC132624428 [Lycium barbarum]